MEREHDCLEHLGDFYEENGNDYRRCLLCGAIYLYTFQYLEIEDFNLDDPKELYIRQPGESYHNSGKETLERLRQFHEDQPDSETTLD